jgi:alanine racemase
MGWAGTIPYEILCAIASRVPRITSKSYGRC